MSQLMQLKDVAENTRLGPLSGEVSAGEILHLVGPNGAGKSTLLARMAGLTSGEGALGLAERRWRHGRRQRLPNTALILRNSKIRRSPCRSGIT